MEGLKKILKGVRDLRRLLESEECKLTVEKLHFDEAMLKTVKRPTDKELRAALTNPTTGPPRSPKEVDAIMRHPGRKSGAQVIDFRIATHVSLRQRLSEAEATIEQELPRWQRPGRGGDLARNFLVDHTLKILRHHGCPTTRGGFSGPSKCEQALALVMADARKRIPDLNVPKTMRGIVEAEQKRLSERSKPRA
jgi:hypothetical protein